MTDEKLEKATDLNDSMKALRNIRRAFCATYPKITVRKISRGIKELFVKDLGDDYAVSFYSLDVTTQEELKKLIIDYIDKRFEELKKEYEEL